MAVDGIYCLILVFINSFINMVFIKHVPMYNIQVMLFSRGSRIMGDLFDFVLSPEFSTFPTMNMYYFM